MKLGSATVLAGIIMIILGAALFYSIEAESNLDDTLRFIKHGGTFVGLMGIGVVMAGILLYLIAREEVPSPENFGSKFEDKSNLE